VLSLDADISRKPSDPVKLVRKKIDQYADDNHDAAK
jgi:hypothetical protein